MKQEVRGGGRKKTNGGMRRRGRDEEYAMELLESLMQVGHEEEDGRVGEEGGEGEDRMEEVSLSRLQTSE